jgi:hypothetical protein
MTRRKRKQVTKQCKAPRNNKRFKFFNAESKEAVKKTNP